MVYGLIFLSVVVASLVVFAGVIGISRFGKRQLQGLVVLSIVSLVALGVTRTDNWLLSDGAVLVTAMLLGVLIGTGIGSGSALVAFAVTAGVIDIISYYGGFTRGLLESYRSGDSLVLRSLTLSLPLGGQIIPLVGIGDFVILGALFFVLRREKAPALFCLVVPLGGLLLALGVGLAVRGVPAIPFMALASACFLFWQRSRGPHQSAAKACA